VEIEVHQYSCHAVLMPYCTTVLMTYCTHDILFDAARKLAEGRQIDLGKKFAEERSAVSE
jgi:hypothetical protein